MAEKPEDISPPKQEQFFSTEKLKRAARAGTQLPSPTMAPFGYDAKSKFNHLFPALELPALFPPQRLHPEDHASFGSPDLPPHKLYLGDNLYVLRGLPSESVDLIYIDPPFFSNRTYTQIWGDDNEVRSFNDIFQDGMFSYLGWLNARLWEMKRVLKSTGSIYVHCDWHASHYIKCEMDKIFGYDRLVNEVIWSYKSGGNSKKSFAKKHDVLLGYSKTDSFTFNVQYYKSWQKKQYNYNPNYPEHFDPVEKMWYHLAICRDVWDDVYVIGTDNKERIGYPTQKPETLLERVINASSNTGDIVADFFMGGGTTGAVALKLGTALCRQRHFPRRDLSHADPHDRTGRTNKRLYRD